MTEQGWYPDPTGRHDHRWWDGTAWTDHVADGGVQSTDALAAGADAASGGTPTGSSGSSVPGSSSSSPSGGGDAWSSSTVPARTSTTDWSSTGATSVPSGSSGGGWPTSAKVTVGVVAIGGLIIGGVAGFTAGVAVDVAEEVSSGINDGGIFGEDPPAVPGQRITSGDTRQLSGVADAAIEFPVTVSGSGEFRATVVSADFDTTLELRRVDGGNVASDDDGGSGTLSDLSVQVTPGEYVLTLDEFGVFNTGGSWQMQVRVP